MISAAFVCFDIPLGGRLVEYCSILYCVCKYVNTESELMTGPTHPLRTLVVCSSDVLA